MISRKHNFSYFADDQGMSPFDFFKTNADKVGMDELIEHCFGDMEMMSHGHGLSLWQYCLSKNEESCQKIL